MEIVDIVPYSIVSVEASQDIVARGRPHTIKAEGPGVYLGVGDLDKLGLAIEVKR